MENEGFRNATLEELLQVNGGKAIPVDASIVTDDDTTEDVPIEEDSDNNSSTDNSNTPTEGSETGTNNTNNDETTDTTTTDPTTDNNTDESSSDASNNADSNDTNSNDQSTDNPSGETNNSTNAASNDDSETSFDNNSSHQSNDDSNTEPDDSTVADHNSDNQTTDESSNEHDTPDDINNAENGTEDSPSADTNSEGTTYNGPTYAQEGANQSTTIDEELERKKTESGITPATNKTVTKPRYFKQREFGSLIDEATGKTLFKKELLRYTCYATSLLNEVSEEYTKATGKQLTLDQAGKALRKAVDDNAVIDLTYTKNKDSKLVVANDNFGSVTNSSKFLNIISNEIGLKGTWNEIERLDGYVPNADEHLIYYNGKHFVNGTTVAGEIFEGWSGNTEIINSENPIFLSGSRNGKYTKSAITETRVFKFNSGN